MRHLRRGRKGYPEAEKRGYENEGNNGDLSDDKLDAHLLPNSPPLRCRRKHGCHLGKVEGDIYHDDVSPKVPTATTLQRRRTRVKMSVELVLK